MEIYGHCRFSWFGISDTGREIVDSEDAARRLWHPLRMAVRFHLFENLMLPSLAVQTDGKFTLSVTFSEDMPDVFKERLHDISKKHSFISLNQTMSRDYNKAISPLMRQSTEDGTIRSVHFRLDDDDALPATYMARLRADADRMDTGGVICYPKGIVGILDGSRARHGYRTVHFHALGLARVAGPGMLHSPIRMQHRKIKEHVPTYVDPTFTGFHLTTHNVNNTRGYGEIIHASGADRRAVENLIAGNPELKEGSDAPAKCDIDIAESFPFSDGPKIRAVLEKAAMPQKLCEEYGFHIP